jgi:hypothetical protein
LEASLLFPLLRLFFADREIHDPAAAYMRARSTQMTENVRVRTACLLKCIRKDK